MACGLSDDEATSFDTGKKKKKKKLKQRMKKIIQSVRIDNDRRRTQAAKC